MGVTSKEAIVLGDTYRDIATGTAIAQRNIEKDVDVTKTGSYCTIRTDVTGIVPNITSTISLALGSGNFKQSN